MFNFDISYILSNKGIFMEDTSHKDLKKSVYLLVDFYQAIMECGPPYE